MKKKLTILVAEDEPDICEALKIRLESNGYAVIIAADGEATLQAVSEHDPDVILLDLMMPKKDGCEVIAELRKQPKWRPVIMASATTNPQETAEARKCEADYYLVKPYKFEALLEAIQNVTSRTPPH